MIVLDASAYIATLAAGASTALRARLAHLETAHVPGDVFDVEVMNAARRLYLQGLLPEGGANQVIADLRDAPFVRHPILPMLEDMWRMRHNYSMQDAAYVVLAARLDLPLITTDGRLATAPSPPCSIESFA